MNFEPTTPCRICRSPIHPAALKCIHCDSWQDWRGSLSVSTTMLSLLIALLSVTGSAGLLLKEVATPKRAAVEGALQYAGLDRVGVLVTNSGARPGTVTFYNFRILDARGDLIDQASLKPDVQGRPAAFIPPGDAQLIEFAGQHFSRPHSLETETGLKCQGVVTGTNFNGRRFHHKQDIRCKDLTFFQRRLRNVDGPGERLLLLPK